MLIIHLLQEVKLAEECRLALISKTRAALNRPKMSCLNITSTLCECMLWNCPVWLVRRWSLIIKQRGMCNERKIINTVGVTLHCVMDHFPPTAYLLGFCIKFSTFYTHWFVNAKNHTNAHRIMWLQLWICEVWTSMEDLKAALVIQVIIYWRGSNIYTTCKCRLYPFKHPTWFILAVQQR